MRPLFVRLRAQNVWDNEGILTVMTGVPSRRGRGRSSRGSCAHSSSTSIQDRISSAGVGGVRVRRNNSR